MIVISVMSAPVKAKPPLADGIVVVVVEVALTAGAV
jgi:hypothetical protein